MARIAQFPGATIEVGKITQSDKPLCANVECTFIVHSPARLLWWAVRTEYDVRWWQWPHTLFVIAKVAILHRLGLWRWFEDEE